VGAIASTDSVFVTPSIKYIQTNGNVTPVSPDAWRKSQAWLDYSFSVTKNSNPAFVIVGAFDDVSERNSWMQCDTTLCTNGLQMHDITGAISATNYYNRVRQWILGAPSAIAGGAIADGCYVVTNQKSGLCLNMQNSVGTNYGYAGLQLIQSISRTNLDNYFMFYHLGTNIYRIISLDSGLALEAINSNAHLPIQQDWDGTGTTQRWTLVSAVNGSYYLQNQASGKVLDVVGAINNGAPVVQNNMTNGAASQQWVFGMVARIELAPPSLNAFKLVSNGFAITFGGPSGQTYKVISSTNIAVPMSSWSVLTSGTFGASAVIYTNTPLTGMQQFYRVTSP